MTQPIVTLPLDLERVEKLTTDGILLTNATAIYVVTTDWEGNERVHAFSTSQYGQDVEMKVTS